MEAFFNDGDLLLKELLVETAEALGRPPHPASPWIRMLGPRPWLLPDAWLRHLAHPDYIITPLGENGHVSPAGNRLRSIFPHPASAWWIPLLLVVGWGPLEVASLLYPHDWKVGEGFGMAWGMAVAVPCTGLAALSTFVQACRLLAHFLSRPSE